DTEPRVVFGNVIRAFQHAVLAADALIIQMSDNARERILLVREHRAAVETGGIRTMMTGRRDGLLNGTTMVASDDEAHIAPGFLVVETIERVARRHARFAAGAGIEIHLESVLFANFRPGERNQITINRFEHRRVYSRLM